MFSILHKLIWKNISDSTKKFILNFFPKFYKQKITQKAVLELSDAIIISFPKCGRTWLRVLLGEIIRRHFNLAQKNLIEIHNLANNNKEIPRIYFSHDDNPHKKKFSELVTNKGQYKTKKIIFLVRDPRDVLVSIFHHKTFRTQEFDGSIIDYLNQDIGSIRTIIEFYNIWFKNKTNVDDFLLIKYENLHSNPFDEVTKILNFIGIKNVKDSDITDSLEFASFKNMRKMETSNEVKNQKLKPINSNKIEGFKTRSGKVGGHKDYFNDEQLEFLNSMIDNHLNKYYSY